MRIPTKDKPESQMTINTKSKICNQILNLNSHPLHGTFSKASVAEWSKACDSSSHDESRVGSNPTARSFLKYFLHTARQNSLMI